MVVEPLHSLGTAESLWLELCGEDPEGPLSHDLCTMSNDTKTELHVMTETETCG